MTILAVRPLPIGNALQVFLAPPVGARVWKLLRKSADNFSGHNDPGAVQVSGETDHNVIVDDLSLENGVAHFYKAYYLDGGSWLASDTATGVAQSTYRDESVDVLDVLRRRVSAGLKVEVQRGTLKGSVGGAIPVLLAPPVFESTPWPVVTLHLQSDSSADRATGEMKFPDVNDVDGLFIEGEGWLAQVSVTVIGWSLNPDERSELRRALRRIIIGNLPVFDSHGMVTCEFSQQDVEDFTSYNAPVYQTMGNFSCRAPAVIADNVAPAVVSVETVSDAYF